MANIIRQQGDILQSQAEVLVNPVNCVGVMGAGLAKQFRSRYPEMNRLYREDCRKGIIKPGVVRLYPAGTGQEIAAFPTKVHWQNPSRPEYIKAGLLGLRVSLIAKGRRSVAVPAIGTGLGGLDWPPVLDLITNILDLDDLTIEIYEPQGRPTRRDPRKQTPAAT